ncbi:MAG TPA: acireductone synthase [Xanthomonadaceae bacterium]|jgi:enolase-phosphatase E1|nr:acireductone synthase [Xanthomonadaceae bacterium]
MSALPATVILTDIEGTTSSIAFVRDVLFPYARAALPGFVEARRHEPEIRRWLDAVALETGEHHHAEADARDEAAVQQLLAWIDEDRKHTALKAIQGQLWKEGYALGEYRAHVYPDAAEAMKRWKDAGHALYVYSSGSVPAQKLFFGHSDAGDLTGLFSGYFDTGIGGKREAASYRHIAADIGVAPSHIVFLSDVVEELDAAREAGLRTVLLDRRSDYPQARIAQSNGHARVEDFDAVEV